jgi:hypothetical protein
MGFPVDFSKEGIVYGLLYRFCDNWVMNFYTSSRGRQIGLRTAKQYSQTIMKFELSLRDIASLARYEPAVHNSTDRRVPPRQMKYLIKGNPGEERSGHGS